MDVADAADLADAECSRSIRRSRGRYSRGRRRDLRSNTRCRRRVRRPPVGRFEIEDAVDIAVGIERQAPDPILRVVGEEIASLIGGRKLRAVIHKSTRDRCIASIVGIVVGRRRVGRIAVRRFNIRPAVVRAPCANVDFLDRGRVVVAADVADDEASGWRVVIGPVGIAQTERPYRIVVGTGSVIEGIVGRYRAVHIEPQDLATRLGEILRFAGVEVLAGRELDLAVIAEVDRAAVVFGVGGLRYPDR